MAGRTARVALLTRRAAAAIAQECSPGLMSQMVVPGGRSVGPPCVTTLFQRWPGNDHAPPSLMLRHSTTIGDTEQAKASTPVPPAERRSRLAAALSLQAGALWQRHRSKAYAAGGVAAVWLVWRATYLIASSFMTVTQTMAEWGLMGLALGIVAIGAHGLKWYVGINPAAVYRQTMLRLNTSPAVLEVMGAPLLGSDVRAYIVSGGSLYLSRKATFRPKISARRVQMIFPLRGAERDGLVSLEAKRKGGRYVFKLLAVDIRPAPGQPAALPGTPGAARLYIEGNAVQYERSTGLADLRDPFLKVAQLQRHTAQQEEVEEEEEARDAAAAQAVQPQRPPFWQRLWPAASTKPEPVAPDTQATSQARDTAPGAPALTSKHQ